MGADGAASVSTSSVLLAIFYGLAYLTAASSIILLNKYVLAVTPFHFPSRSPPWASSSDGPPP